MAILKGDVSVAANGDIRHSTGTSNHEVLELHRLLMGIQDDTTATGDDYLDVTNEIIPSTRRTDQIIVLNAPYNIDQTLSERLYGGSVEYDDGDELFSGLITYGSFNAGTTEIQVLQNGSLLANHWSTGKNKDAALNITNRILVKSRTAGADIDGKRIISMAREWGDTFAEFPTILGAGEAVASLTTLPDAFNVSVQGTIDAMSGDFTYTTGFQGLDVDVDGSDEDYLGSWDITGSGTKAYLYEYVKSVTIRGETGTTIFGFAGELYRGATHEIDYDGQTVNLTEGDLLTFSGGATGYLLADNDGGATGTLWIQLMTGVAPADGETIADEGTGDGTVDTNITSRTIAATPIGSYTGNFTTAYGVAIEPTDLTKDDVVTALDNTTKNPPNYVNVVINSLVNTDIVFAHRTIVNAYTVDASTYSIGDTVITMTGSLDTTEDPQVGKIVIDGVSYAFKSWTTTDVTLAGSGLTAGLSGGEAVTLTSWDKDMYELLAETSSGTTLTMATSIVKDIPPAGYLRIWNASTSAFDRLEYLSFTGAIFTMNATITNTYLINADIFIAFIDEAATGSSISKQIVYTVDIPSKLRMYNSTLEIVPFEVPFTIGSGGNTTPAIRNSDA